MDHDQVEMGHRRLDGGGRVRIIVQIGDELGHQPRNLIEFGAFVDDLASRAVSDENLARAPQPRSVVEVVARHHEVEALEELFAVVE